MQANKRRQSRALVYTFAMLGILVSTGVYLVGQAQTEDITPTTHTNEGQAEKVAQDGADSYNALLKKHVNAQGLVNYGALKADRAGLDSYIKWLGSFTADDYKDWSNPEKIAFWINAYNACTLQLLIDHHPITDKPRINQDEPANSIMQIDGAWKKFTFNLLGEDITLDSMEHKKLRVEFKEPRIHMALVCGAVSCPYLRNEAYQASTLEAQLSDQTKTFLSLESNLKIEKSFLRKKVTISKIFDWFSSDFPELNTFLGTYGPKEHQDFLKSGTYKTGFSGYSWLLNEQ